MHFVGKGGDCFVLICAHIVAKTDFIWRHITLRGMNMDHNTVIQHFSDVTWLYLRLSWGESNNGYKVVFHLQSLSCRVDGAVEGKPTSSWGSPPLWRSQIELCCPSIWGGSNWPGPPEVASSEGSQIGPYRQTNRWFQSCWWSHEEYTTLDFSVMVAMWQRPKDS